MEQIFNLLGVGLTWVVALIGGLVAAFWMGLAIWTWRDIRSRSADIFAALLAVLLVLIFNVIGLLIYVLVRPKQTLAEQYDRALEEEILLRELEQAPSCPACGRPTKPEWQYCPYCEAELKHPCHQCGYLLEPEWKRCPQCGASAQQDVAPAPPPAPKAEPATPEPEQVALVPPPPAPEPVVLPETMALSEAEAIAKAEELKAQGLTNTD